MHDTTTQVGPLAAEGPTPDSRPKVRARRVSLVPLKRFTRAHLELAARHSTITEAAQALELGIAAVGEQLGQPVTASARLLDATLQPLTHLGRDGLFLIIELSSASAMAIIELEGPVTAFLIHHAAGSDLQTVAPTSLTRVETAALGWLALSVLKGARAAGAFEARYGPRLVGLTMDRGEALRSIDATVRHLAIEVHLRSEHPIGLARVLVPAKLLQAAIHPAPLSDPPPALDAVLDVPLSLGCRIGHAELQRADSGDLSPGDVIVFAGTSMRGGALAGPACFFNRTFLLNGVLGADGFTVSRVTTRPPEPPMSTSVAVDVEIELTTIQVPIRQLGTLAPGSVLPLHINAAQSVTLRIDGRPVAIAELVEVEGEIGARIVSMLERAAP